jgi:hypothetical protein
MTTPFPDHSIRMDVQVTLRDHTNSLGGGKRKATSDQEFTPAENLPEIGRLLFRCRRPVEIPQDVEGGSGSGGSARLSVTAHPLNRFTDAVRSVDRPGSLAHAACTHHQVAQPPPRPSRTRHRYQYLRPGS